MKLFDYHIHTDLSLDSKTTIAEAVKSATEKGLSEIAITNHFEFMPYGCLPKYSLEKYREYYKKYLEFLSENPDSIPIRFGAELAQCYSNPTMCEEFLNSVPFDFVLASIHFIDDIVLYGNEYTKDNIDWFMKKYLEYLYKTADTCDFDCLAHLDLIKRYAAWCGMQVEFSDYEDELIPILKRVIERGKGIEINTSGLRQGVNETLPGLYILKLYKALGGKILTIGSDAHEKENIGANITDGLSLALKAGFTEICTFKGRKPIFHPIG